ncbi:hypothetical protein PCC7424_2411 [Gloeothece citriformis PCC 7424]|uniref:Uncharacterized protein n=1 Tax=Gloeothece citriformis (strain PCC 7424) TaxID=65393 RepID=B7KIZ6_GLOC7|nr:hypothetical protein [Gloeothece citriformis]ACK70832.1 hypothetical protein PCC7424_2411 [Gloeothece citriformis PCC 7424]
MIASRSNESVPFDVGCRLPLSLVRSLLADQLAYQQLKAEHLKALSVLTIHAADDAGAREVVENSQFREVKL